MGNINIASWNILAAPWASPSFYPPELDLAILDRNRRGKLNAAMMAAVADVHDVWCLQEVTVPELERIRAALSEIGDFEAFHAHNAPEYWSNWLVDGVDWEANGPALIVRGNGVAADDNTVREQRVFQELRLGEQGNAAASMCAVDAATGSRYRVVAIHLDADSAETRCVELRSLIAQLEDPVVFGEWCSVPVVVAGDFNCDTVEGEIADMLRDAGFVDAHTACGQLDPTHPLARPGDSYVALARIDHIMVRGLQPVTSAVMDAGVFTIEAPGERFLEHLRRTGTDHLMIAATCHLQ